MLVAKYRVVSHNLLVATIEGRDEVLILLGYTAVTGTTCSTSARCRRGSSGSKLRLITSVGVVLHVEAGVVRVHVRVRRLLSGRRHGFHGKASRS